MLIVSQLKKRRLLKKKKKYAFTTMRFHGVLQGTVAVYYDGWVWSGTGEGGLKYDGEYSLKQN